MTLTGVPDRPLFSLAFLAAVARELHGVRAMVNDGAALCLDASRSCVAAVAAPRTTSVATTIVLPIAVDTNAGIHRDR
jgi:hypothetical protein